ncbi:MAG: cell division protein FtsQ [Caulobacteraceae bacterium]|nr:cell division protein FtsQ [Caulobacteraceae bacterium]
MPAAVRGEGRAKSAGSRAKKAPPKEQRRAPPPRSGQVAGKLRAAEGALPPHLALAGAGLVLAIALIVTLATGHRLQRMIHAVQHGAAVQMAGAGFKIGHVHVQGASPMATPDIAAAAAYAQGQPILDLDLGVLRAHIEQVGWVKSARIVRLLPDTLIIGVTERNRMAVWQHAGQSYVVDNEGRLAPEANPALFPDLPLIVGEGAPQAAQAILAELHSRPDLAPRVEALVRVDGRRWDLNLKGGGLIQLPAEGEEAALLRLDQMQARQHILDLALARIDLRNPDETAVRLKGAPPPSSPPTAIQGA